MIVELYESHTTTAANIVREYGIGSATLYKWVGQYGKIQTPDDELTNNKEIKKLKKELNDLKIENEILKKPWPYSCRNRRKIQIYRGK